MKKMVMVAAVLLMIAALAGCAAQQQCKVEGTWKSYTDSGGAASTLVIDDGKLSVNGKQYAEYKVVNPDTIRVRYLTDTTGKNAADVSMSADGKHINWAGSTFFKSRGDWQDWHDSVYGRR